MIVGYAGVFVTFAIMISIVIGLMSRLIKGAALFLVYPSILGIAPLDDFKAFKSWGQMFMQQVMMAFGSIIGMNLLLLILPYVQQIEFFKIDIINYIVNVVMMITGLIMAKDFISIVSGFVGGADANASGGEMKGQVAGTIKSGINPGAKIAGGVARVTGKTGVLVGKGVKAGAKAAKRKISNMMEWGGTRADFRKKRLEKREKKYSEMDTLKQNIATNEKMSRDYVERLAQSGAFKAQGDSAYNAAKAQGWSENKAQEARDKAVENAKQQAYENDLAGSKKYAQDKQRLAALEKERSQDTTLQRREANLKETVDKYHLTEGSYGYYQDKAGRKQYVKDAFQVKDANGNVVADGFKGFLKQAKGDVAEWGKTFGDSVMKTLNSGLEGLGIDKTIKAITGQLGESLTFKGGPFKPKREGDALQRQIASEQKKQADTQTKILQDIKKELSKQNSKGSSGGSGGSSGGGSSGGSGGTPTTP